MGREHDKRSWSAIRHERQQIKRKIGMVGRLRNETNNQQKTIKELCGVIILFKSLISDPVLRDQQSIPEVCIKIQSQ